ncbi:hypothetical protein HK097_002502, partial [Rhizophlyctis rosea]
YLAVGPGLGKPGRRRSVAGGSVGGVAADSERRAYPCTICDETFDSWSRRYYHERDVHGRNIASGGGLAALPIPKPNAVLAISALTSQKPPLRVELRGPAADVMEHGRPLLPAPETRDGEDVTSKRGREEGRREKRREGARKKARRERGDFGEGVGGEG